MFIVEFFNGGCDTQNSRCGWAEDVPEPDLVAAELRGAIYNGMFDKKTFLRKLIDKISQWRYTVKYGKKKKTM